MEDFSYCVYLSSGSCGVDEEFRSCCGEDEDWQDADETLSDGDMEGNEEVPSRISERHKEEVDDSSLRISEVLKEDNDESLRMSMGHEKESESSTTFSEGFEEIALECSVRLPEGNEQEIVSECSLRLSKCNEEVVSVCSLRLSEDYEEDVSECSLRLSQSTEEEVLECALGLFEGCEEDILGCSLRLCEDHEEGISECSLIFSEDHDEDTCECSLRLSENYEEVSECSLIFSEDHKDDILECSLRLSEDHVEDDDGFSVRVFFKGVSVSENSGLGSRISGIGVVMEKSEGVPFIQVQKKLDFFVEESIAEHLALMDGLLVALRNGFQKVLSFTDSSEVYRLVVKNDTVDDQLFIALRERIHELVDKFDSFVLKLVPKFELKRSLQLAEEAIGILGHLIECPICGEGKHKSKMIAMHCSHKLCADCMCRYVESKVRRSQVPIKCPLLRCKYSFSNSLCRFYLPSTSFESLDGLLAEIEERNLWRFYCPFPDCSMLLSPPYCSPSRESSLIHPNINCIECPECCRLVCARCQVPWHSLMRCEEYLHLPSEEINNGDTNLHQMAQSSSWRRCQQCRQMIELAGGCYHVTCCNRCGHEFCFSCGAEYRAGTRTCRCEVLGESLESSQAPSEHEAEVWRWDCFNPLPATIDGYTEQEKAQLAMIQRFLAGGISVDNHTTCQSPPRPSDSYLDTIKDLNQLPWLESFISVIGDSYQEDHFY